MFSEIGPVDPADLRRNTTTLQRFREELQKGGLLTAHGVAPAPKPVPGITTQEQYDVIAKELLDEASRIETSKRPGYTGGNTDVLKNFKSVAARLGLTPEQAWGVYFLKHIDAISTIMAKPELPVSEAPLGRFADAINYLKLGYALFKERG
jgi:hypothetical protein